MQLLIHLFVARLHALQECGLVFGRETLEIEGLAGSDSDTGELGPNLFFFGSGWHELERGIQILEVVRLDPRRGGRNEINLRPGWRRGLLEERGKRLRLVARLDLYHVRHVFRVE